MEEGEQHKVRLPAVVVVGWDGDKRDQRLPGRGREHTIKLIPYGGQRTSRARKFLGVIEENPRSSAGQILH